MNREEHSGTEPKSYLLYEGWREFFDNPQHYKDKMLFAGLARYSWGKLNLTNSNFVSVAEVSRRWCHLIEDIAEFIFDPAELDEVPQVEIITATVAVIDCNIRANSWVADGLRFWVFHPDDSEHSRVFDLVTVYVSEDVDDTYLEQLLRPV